MTSTAARDRRRARVVLVLRIAIAACALLPAACGRRPPDAPAATIRVATYNVYFDTQDRDAIAALLASIDADVVALQEITPAMAAALRGALADRYPYMAFHVGRLGNGPGVLARWPAADARYLPSAHGLNGAWIGTFDVGGRRVQIVNVHLHPSSIGGANPIAVKRAYDRAEGVRVAQLDELLPHPAGPAILLGDLNSLPGSPTLARLADLGWRDGLAGTAAAAAPTYHFRGLGFHLDHVLVAGGVTCRDGAVVARGPSDHQPVTALCTLR